MIQVELVGNSIQLAIDYSPKAVAACKSVRGGRWNPRAKRWAYPLDYNTCVEIRTRIANVVGQELKIGPELTQWAINEKARLAAIPEANSLERADLPTLEQFNAFAYEALNNRPFQTVGVKFAAAHRQVVNADEPGLGKTIQTIGAIIEADVRGPVLIIAPKQAAELTWPAQLAYWAPDEKVVQMAGLTPAKREDAMDQFWNLVYPEVGQRIQRQWLIVNPHWIMTKAKLDDKGNYAMEKGQKQLDHKMPDIFRIDWAAVIVDESHDILIANTMNRKKWIQARIGAEALPLVDNAMKIALSGTPMRGKKENFFGTLQWLKPKHYTSYWKWAERNFEIVNDGYSSSVGALADPEGFARDLKEVMIRRTKSEVAKDLPAKIYGGTRLNPDDPQSPVGVWLPMSGKQEKQYLEMQRNASVNVDGGTLIANGILSEWTRLKQLATSAGKFEGEKFVPDSPSNKMDCTLEFLAERGIQDHPDGDGKVIIVSQFAEVCKFINRQLGDNGIPSFVLTGETTGAKRQQAMDMFQSNQTDIRVFILSTKAGGVSLTLDAADDVVIWDETYIPDNQLQVEDRAHRVSRPDHQVSIWYLRTLGTIEEAIAATTGERQENMDLILDKTRGVEIRKRIKEYVPVSRTK